MTINPLASVSYEDTYWSRANVSEAFPGVITPLGWDLLNDGVESGMREAYFRQGLLPPAQLAVPNDPRDRILNAFYGHGALNVTFFASIGASWPGIDQVSFVRGFLGYCPDELNLPKQRSRSVPYVVRGSWNQITVSRRVERGVEGVSRWWQRRITELESSNIDAYSAFAEAREVFHKMLRLQAVGLFLGVQGPFTVLDQLVSSSDLSEVSHNAIWGGHGGHMEVEMIQDLWRLGKGKISLDDFLGDYGYHGPNEGDITGVVWREDPSPVIRLAEQYASSVTDPSDLIEERAQKRELAEQELLQKLPHKARPRAKWQLKMARKRLPLRGVAKRGFLQALDVLRASTRVLGAELSESGVISGPEDIVFLNAGEIASYKPRGASLEQSDDLQGRIAVRREEHQYWSTISLPEKWRGQPDLVEGIHENIPIQQATITGVGASVGVSSGRVKVVDESNMSSVKPGDIVVCSITDPSWTAVLLLCAGLVVDTGGPLSHAAVVARELGIPCIVGTGDAKSRLSDGTLVRIDGNEGTVEVVEGVPPNYKDS